MCQRITRGCGVVAATVTLLLGGCSGGDSGVTLSSLETRDTVVFTSFADLQADKNVRASGVSQSATLTMNVASLLVTNVVIDTVDTTSSYLTLGFNSAVELDGARAESATTDLSWSTAMGDTVTDDGVAYTIVSADGAESLVLGDARDSWVNWNYQTFGVWQHTTVVGPTATVEIGAISAGSPSPVSGIPTTGTASYAGVAAGIYVDPTGELFSTAATLTSSADFLSRRLSFNTVGTTTVNASGATAAAPDLNLSGTLGYGVSSNQFSGAVSSAGGTLNGTAVGKFYGPNAEEIGGTYELSDGGVETMIGGFGAKR